MPDIEITESQLDRLGAVQEALEAEVVGKYSHVRPADALEYLLDRYESDVDAGNDGGGTDASNDDAGDGDSDDGADDGSGEDDEGPAEDHDESADDDGSTGDDDAGPATGDDDAELDAMMNLLSEHDDVWDESSSSDARYEVELPDGSTEPARTKDDVRGLLFKHYR